MFNILFHFKKASVAAIVVGIVSYEEAVEVDGMVINIPPVIANHPFAGPLFYNPLPLFGLIIAAALTIAGCKRAV